MSAKDADDVTPNDSSTAARTMQVDPREDDEAHQARDEAIDRERRQPPHAEVAREERDAEQRGDECSDTTGQRGNLRVYPLVRACSRSSGSPAAPARAITGVASRKVKRSASSWLSLARSDATIVTPDREMPGSSASDCVRPMRNACWNVSVVDRGERLFLLSAIHALRLDRCRCARRTAARRRSRRGRRRRSPATRTALAPASPATRPISPTGMVPTISSQIVLPIGSASSRP